MKKHFYLMAMLMLACFSSAWSMEETTVYFTADTEEGVTMTFGLSDGGFGYYHCFVGGEPSDFGYPAAAIDRNTQGRVTIPKEVYYNGSKYEVTSIGTGAFNTCGWITSVILPESVNHIGESAFSGCWNLKSIVLPEKVYVEIYSTFLSYGAFEGCSALEEIELPEGTEGLPNGVFSNCRSLKSISLPSTLQAIDYDAFSFCSSLQTVIVKADVPPTLFDESVFDYCLEASPTLYVPQGRKDAYLEATGWNKFTNIEEMEIDYQDGDTFVASNDEGIDITYKVLSAADKTCQVGDGDDTAFASETTGNVTIPAAVNGFTVTAIGEAAFSDSNVSFVYMPDGIESIDEYAFLNCCQIREIVLPKGLTRIDRMAISGCPNLETLFWPSNVYTMSLPTISNCPKLSRIEMENYTEYGDCDAVIRANSIVIGCKTTVIPEGITGVDGYAFYECTSLTDITLPTTLLRIGEDAFYGCSGLSSIVLPENVTSIGRNAFRCENLMEVRAEMVTPPAIYSNTFTNRANAILYVPAGSSAAYHEAQYWRDFMEIVEFDSTATGISLTPSTKAEGSTYDLSGRRISAPARGVYVKQGRKVVVK